MDCNNFGSKKSVGQVSSGRVSREVSHSAPSSFVQRVERRSARAWQYLVVRGHLLRKNTTAAVEMLLQLLNGRQHARGGGRGASAHSQSQHMQSPGTPTASRQQSPGGGGGGGCGGGTFRVTLSMKKEPDGGPVFCKMEQTQRFKQLKTVKLHTDTVYRIDVSFKPPRALQSLVIQGQEMEPCERARDSTACAYSSYYNTEGLSPSKKGTREDLTIIMKVDGSGELSTCLQIKLYKAHDIQHCEWGSRLHCIELDCTSTEGPEGVRVNRETYRKLGLDS